MVFTGVGLTLVKVPNPFSDVAHGDYTSGVVFALAALLNGICWEGWNHFSAPHNPSYWRYDIPFLNGAYLFEMPIVGYLGYLPFGICCCTMWLSCISLTDLAGKLTWKSAFTWLVICVIFLPCLFMVGFFVRDLFPHLPTPTHE